MTFLWLNFCFHDTAPICISAVALGTPPLTHVFPCPWSRSQAHVSPGPRLASLLGKPVRLWPSGGNGLELFRAHSQLAYKVSTQRNRLFPFSVWSEPWAWKQPWNPTGPFPDGFLCRGSDLGFLICTPGKFQNKVGRKEVLYRVSPMSQTHRGSAGLALLTLFRVAVSERSSRLTKVTQISGETKFKA